MQSFGDPFLRLFGVKMRHFINGTYANGLKAYPDRAFLRIKTRANYLCSIISRSVASTIPHCFNTNFQQVFEYRTDSPFECLLCGYDACDHGYRNAGRIHKKPAKDWLDIECRGVDEYRQFPYLVCSSFRTLTFLHADKVWNSMIASANFKPYYDAITKSTLIQTIEPIKVFAGIPPDQYQQQAPGFAATFNAVNQMVCT